jgi:hypothetical protein
VTGEPLVFVHFATSGVGLFINPDLVGPCIMLCKRGQLQKSKNRSDPSCPMRSWMPSYSPCPFPICGRSLLLPWSQLCLV